MLGLACSRPSEAGASSTTRRSVTSMRESARPAAARDFSYRAGCHAAPGQLRAAIRGLHSELFDYVLGAYYFKEVGDQKNLRSATLDIRDAGLLSDNGQDTESWALFGQTEIHVTDALTLVAGGRYTRDAREFRLDGLVLRDGTRYRRHLRLTAGKIPRGKLGANYRAWEDTLLYASVSTGYKGGGYNSRATIAANIGPYDDEEVTSYEIGAKSTLLDNRLRVNVAASTPTTRT